MQLLDLKEDKLLVKKLSVLEQYLGKETASAFLQCYLHRALDVNIAMMKYNTRDMDIVSRHIAIKAPLDFIGLQALIQYIAIAYAKLPLHSIVMPDYVEACLRASLALRQRILFEGGYKKVLEAIKERDHTHVAVANLIARDLLTITSVAEKQKDTLLFNEVLRPYYPFMLRPARWAWYQRQSQAIPKMPKAFSDLTLPIVIRESAVKLTINNLFCSQGSLHIEDTMVDLSFALLNDINHLLDNIDGLESNQSVVRPHITLTRITPHQYRLQFGALQLDITEDCLWQLENAVRVLNYQYPECLRVWRSRWGDI